MDLKIVFFILHIVTVFGKSDTEYHDKSMRRTIYNNPGPFPDSGQDHDFIVPNKRQDRTGAFTDAEKQAILDKHNELRAQEPASNMRYMMWDEELEQSAQTFAERCIYLHPYADLQARGVGQNLAYHQDPNLSAGVHATENQWYYEIQWYTYDTNTCNAPPKKDCGHYTQVVWADSNRLGCGRKFCATANGTGDKDVYLIVCEYSPGGNIQYWTADGQLVKQKPYLKGNDLSVRCSICPNDARYCYENLCRDCSQATDKAACGECRRQCQNCGTLDPETCTCQCAPGWEGLSCQNECADHHERCGWNQNGFPESFCETDENVRINCPKMCGVCQPQDPNFSCGGGGGGGGGSGAGTEPQVVKKPKYCKASFTDATVIDNNLFVFKQKQFWRFDAVKNGNLLTSPQGDVVSETFLWFPRKQDISAIYQRPDRKVVIFKDKKVRLFTKQGDTWSLDPGYPRDSDEQYPGLIKPKAAVYDSTTSKSYFFYGKKFWTYDENAKQLENDGKGQLMSERFAGVPYKITGAFIDDSDFILVKGRDFWRVPAGETSATQEEGQNLALEFMNCPS